MWIRVEASIAYIPAWQAHLALDQGLWVWAQEDDFLGIANSYRLRKRWARRVLYRMRAQRQHWQKRNHRKVQKTHVYRS